MNMASASEEPLRADQTKLYYVHDPMCSWCYAFNPVWETLSARLPPSVQILQILGGLAPDTDQPMPEAMRAKIQEIWRTIEKTVPGTRFNFDFWKSARPRRATFPACRAVIAAAHQAPELETKMIRLIQHAYYREAKNPSDYSVLIALADSLGLDGNQFAADLDSPQTVAELNRQIAFSRRLGVPGFPSLVCRNAAVDCQLLEIDYQDAEFMLHQILRLSEYRT
jgi:putative protein-disulfide isomerase